MAQSSWTSDCAAFVTRHFCTIASSLVVIALPVFGYLYQQELETDKEVATALSGLQSDMKLVMFRLDNPALRQNANSIPAHVMADE